MKNTIKLNLNYDESFEMRERNWRGEVLKGDKSCNFLLEVPVTISFKDNYNCVGFLIKLKISKEHIKSIPNKTKDTVFTLATKIFPKVFVDRKNWDIFSINEILLDHKLSKDLIENNKLVCKNFEIELEVSDEIQRSLEKMNEEYKEVRQNFDSIVSKLEEYIKNCSSHGFSYHYGEISQLLYLLSKYVGSSRYGFLSNWYEEKMGRLNLSFADLNKRTRESNKNYQNSLSTARRILINFSASKFWKNRPPELDIKSMLQN